MPLQSLLYQHIPKNIALLLLSLAFLPLSAAVTTICLLSTTKHASKSPSRPGNTQGHKTILVTGVSMTKGLTIARLLSRQTPHRIIGADIESSPFISPGRYSRSLSKFYRLDPPDGDDAEPCIDSLLTVIKNENVDLWISCSSVSEAVQDGEIMECAKEEMGEKFQAVQFDGETIAKLHEKDSFIGYLQKLGLTVPESHRCVSREEVEGVLKETEEKRFVLKPIGVDDKARNQMMTLLPLERGMKETGEYLSTLNISSENPYLLQQFIDGKEYCTHSLVVRGEVKAFVACPSSDLLMHYEALSPESVSSRKMLEFTKTVAENGGEGFTGHLSFDFLVEDGKDEKDVELYPIECNPRAHTAVVLFRDTPAMAGAYMSIFDETNRSSRTIVTPSTPRKSYYWLAHDLVTLLILPLLTLLSSGKSNSNLDMKASLRDFADHLLNWNEGAFLSWDPVPFFVLYHVYWPMRLLGSLLTGRGWERVNVSTGKMFGV